MPSPLRSRARTCWTVSLTQAGLADRGSAVAPAGERLGIDAADGGGVGDPLHGKHVGRGAHVDMTVDAGVQDLVEGAGDHVVELGVDLLLLPEEGLEVLHPL